MVKSTYGTGCFALLNTGAEPRRLAATGCSTTVAYQLGGKRTYALEGAIFVAGAAVQWLRDGLGLIAQRRRDRRRWPREADPAAGRLSGAGLRRARRAALGCRGARRALRPHARHRSATSSRAPRSRASCYQTRDLLDAMRARLAAAAPRRCCASTAAWWRPTGRMQCLADMLDAPVDRPMILETTALGAAYLAGLQAGVYPEPEEFADNWRLDRRFRPVMSAATRYCKLKGWARAVKGVLASDEGEG